MLSWLYYRCQCGYMRDNDIFHVSQRDTDTRSKIWTRLSMSTELRGIRECERGHRIRNGEPYISKTAEVFITPRISRCKDHCRAQRGMTLIAFRRSVFFTLVANPHLRANTSAYSTRSSTSALGSMAAGSVIALVLEGISSHGTYELAGPRSERWSRNESRATLRRLSPLVGKCGSVDGGKHNASGGCW